MKDPPVPRLWKKFIGYGAVQTSRYVRKHSECALETNSWAHIFRFMTSPLKHSPKDYRDEAIRDAMSIQVLMIRKLFEARLMYFMNKYTDFKQTKGLYE